MDCEAEVDIYNTLWLFTDILPQKYHMDSPDLAEAMINFINLGPSVDNILRRASADWLYQDSPQTSGN